MEFDQEISMVWPRIGPHINGTRVFPNDLFLGRVHWPLKSRSIFHDFGAAKPWWISASLSVQSISHIKWCHMFWTCSTKNRVKWNPWPCLQGLYLGIVKRLFRGCVLGWDSQFVLSNPWPWLQWLGTSVSG